MRKFLDWFIVKIGGYTGSQYNNLLDEKKELTYKNEALQDSTKKFYDWVSKPVYHGEMRGERFCATATVSLQDDIPTEYLKRDLCRNMAELLFDKGLVEFDIYDCKEHVSKMYRATIEVSIPAHAKVEEHTLSKSKGRIRDEYRSIY